MTRAQIDKRIFIETERGALLGPWLIHSLQKAKRASKWAASRGCLDV